MCSSTSTSPSYRAIVIHDWEGRVVDFLFRAETFFNVGDIKVAESLYQRAKNVVELHNSDFKLPPFPVAVSTNRETEYRLLKARRQAAVALAQQTYGSETEVVEYKVTYDGENVRVEYLGVFGGGDRG